MKIKKHQKNLKALIHNYANGVQSEMVSGNVSSHADGDETVLLTYSTTLARRKVFDDVSRVPVFLINSRNYSISSSRHKGALLHSIPYALRDVAEDTLDWKRGEEYVRLQLKNGSAVTLFCDGPFMSFSHDVVESSAKQVQEFLQKIKNNRVHAVKIWEIWSNFTTLKKAQWFQKILNQREDAERKESKTLRKVAKVFRKTAEEYVKRVAKKNAETAERRAKAEDVSRAIVRSHLDQFGEVFRDRVELCLDVLKRRRDGWRNGTVPMHLTTPSAVFGERVEGCDNLFRDAYDELVRRKKAQAFATFSHFIQFVVREIAGEDVFADTGEVLRIQGDVVVTSRGAEVPEGIASRVFRRHADELRKDAHVFEPPVAVGPFYMREVRDGVVLIGCHSLNQKDLLRLAEERGW